MISPTQTMENTTEVEYISIYDKPKIGRGRPKTCKLSYEEKKERLRVNYKAYYYADPERERARKRREYAQNKVNPKNMNFENQLVFWLYEKMNFLLNIRHPYNIERNQNII